MTSKRYTNICVRKDLYKRFKALADAHNKTNPDFLEYLLTLLPTKPANKISASPTKKDASLELWQKQYKRDMKDDAS